MAISNDSLDRDFSLRLSVSASLPSQFEEPFGFFILQIRAAHILGKVVSLVRRPIICSSNCLEARFHDLDSDLQIMSFTALKMSADGAGRLPCVASPLVFT